MRTKLPTLGVTRSPSLVNLLAQPGQPGLVVRDAALDMGAVADRRDAGLDRRGVDVEGTAHAVDARRRCAVGAYIQPIRSAAKAEILEKVRVITTFSAPPTSSMPAS